MRVGVTTANKGCEWPPTPREREKGQAKEKEGVIGGGWIKVVEEEGGCGFHAGRTVYQREFWGSDLSTIRGMRDQFQSELCIEGGKEVVFRE